MVETSWLRRRQSRIPVMPKELWKTFQVISGRRHSRIWKLWQVFFTISISVGELFNRDLSFKLFYSARMDQFLLIALS